MTNLNIKGLIISSAVVFLALNTANAADAIKEKNCSKTVKGDCVTQVQSLTNTTKQNPTAQSATDATQDNAAQDNAAKQTAQNAASPASS